MSEKKQLEWIRMQLTPLPHLEGELQTIIVFWNLDTGEVRGEEAAQVLNLVKEYARQGSIKTSKGEVIQLDDPLRNTVAFSTILSQRYWVSPQPVEIPEEPDRKNLQ
jgi:hypothetical protein